MRTERKLPLNVRAVQRLYHSRQEDYLAKDDVSIFKQVEVVLPVQREFHRLVAGESFQNSRLGYESLAPGPFLMTVELGGLLSDCTLCTNLIRARSLFTLASSHVRRFFLSAGPLTLTEKLENSQEW